MHPLMLQKVIEACRARIAEGDYPTTPAFTVEQLEDAVVELATRSDAQRDVPREPTRRQLCHSGRSAVPGPAPAAHSTCAISIGQRTLYR